MVKMDLNTSGSPASGMSSITCSSTKSVAGGCVEASGWRGQGDEDAIRTSAPVKSRKDVSAQDRLYIHPGAFLWPWLASVGAGADRWWVHRVLAVTLLSSHSAWFFSVSMISAGN